jgi:hypothetical protein
MLLDGKKICFKLQKIVEKYVIMLCLWGRLVNKTIMYAINYDKNANYTRILKNTKIL